MLLEVLLQPPFSRLLIMLLRTRVLENLIQLFFRVPLHAGATGAVTQAAVTKSIKNDDSKHEN